MSSSFLSQITLFEITQKVSHFSQHSEFDSKLCKYIWFFVLKSAYETFFGNFLCRANSSEKKYYLLFCFNQKIGAVFLFAAEAQFDYLALPSEVWSGGLQFKMIINGISGSISGLPNAKSQNISFQNFYAASIYLKKLQTQSSEKSLKNETFWRFLKKYVGVQSWKAAHLPTLEIQVEQKGNRVIKERKMEEKRKNAAATGIEPVTCR